MEWNEFKAAVKEAKDQEELEHLKSMDGRWFEDAVEELKKEGR